MIRFLFTVFLLTISILSCSDEDTVEAKTNTSTDTTDINNLVDSFELHLKNKDATLALADIHPESTDYPALKESGFFSSGETENASESSLLNLYYFDFKTRTVTQTSTGYTMTGTYDAFSVGQTVPSLSDLNYNITLKKNQTTWKIFRLDLAKSKTSALENVLKLLQ